MKIKDYHILSKIKKGDIKSFEHLFHQFYPGLCTYAESLVNSSEIAEEMVQEVFYNIWKNRNVLNISSSIEAYLFRATYNNSMMYLRRSKRELTLDEKWAEKQLKTESDFAAEIDARELNTLIIFTLNALPERTQNIFRMNRFDGLKYKQIAEKLNISIKTVEANMGKALKALRIVLENYRKTA